MLTYIGGGILAVLVMRMFGEMAVAQPDTGSFIVMAWEGTYVYKVVYTLLLSTVIVAMGLVTQRFNIGTPRKGD